MPPVAMPVNMSKGVALCHTWLAVSYKNAGLSPVRSRTPSNYGVNLTVSDQYLVAPDMETS